MSDDPVLTAATTTTTATTTLKDPYELITPTLLVNTYCMDRLRDRAHVEVSTMRVVGQGIAGTVSL